MSFTIAETDVRNSLSAHIRSADSSMLLNLDSRHRFVLTPKTAQSPNTSDSFYDTGTLEMCI